MSTIQRPLLRVGWIRCPDLTLSGSDWTYGGPPLACREGSDGLSAGYVCTRRKGHGGRHAAGTGEIIVAVWGDGA